MRHLQDILLYHCDSILRDSEALVETMPKFASIVQRLRQLPPKFAALRVLVNSTPTESPNLRSFTHKRLLSRIDGKIEQLTSLIWMFEKEMAFRKNSLWDFALTENRDLFTIISSAWEHGVYVDSNLISQLLNK